MSHIIYLHGFMSHPQSAKATALGEALKPLNCSYHTPFLPVHPQQAIELIDTLIRQCQPEPITLIGSSLGGFFATYFTEKYQIKSVLINPVVHAHEILDIFYGLQTHPHTGETFVVDEQDRQHLLPYDTRTINYPDKYLVYLQTGDEILDYRLATELYKACDLVVIKGGNHRFKNFDAIIPEILRFSSLA